MIEYIIYPLAVVGIIYLCALFWYKTRHCRYDLLTKYHTPYKLKYDIGDVVRIDDILCVIVGAYREKDCKSYSVRAISQYKNPTERDRQNVDYLFYEDAIDEHMNNKKEIMFLPKE